MSIEIPGQDASVDAVISDGFVFIPMGKNTFVTHIEHMMKGPRPHARDGNFYFDVLLDAEQKRLGKNVWKDIVAGKKKSRVLDRDELLNPPPQQNRN